MNIEQALETIKELKYKLSTTTTVLTNDISNLQSKLRKSEGTIMQLNQKLKYKDNTIDNIIRTVEVFKGTIGILVNGKLMTLQQATEYIHEKNPDKEYEVISREVNKVIRGKRKAGKLYGTMASIYNEL